jgi:hypothetical protein
MKAILKFDTNDADDRLSFERCTRADDLYGVIWQFIYNERKKIENTVDEGNLDSQEVIQLVYDTLHGLLKDESLDLERLYP